jgi:predicted  nucleic acid-binding Zn-ribbon protein
LEEKIRLIVKLQKLDSEIDNLENSREKLNAKLESLKEGFARKEKELEEEKNSFGETEKKLRSGERELQVVEGNLKKYRDTVYKITSQKEMESLDHEIESAKEQKLKVEEEILNLMERSEELKEGVSKREKELEAEKKILEKEEEGCRREIKDMENKLGQLSAEKKEVIGGIEEKLFTQYEKLRQSKEGLAVVEIKNGACQGCYLTLPPQIVNEIKGGKRIIRCESCARILYWRG